MDRTSMTREKLATLRLRDFDGITGCLDVNQGMTGPCLRKVELGPWYMSSMCLSTEEIGHMVRLSEGEDLERRLHIYGRGRCMGVVDYSGGFHYLAADSLEACLGWMVATDPYCGEVANFDLKLASRKFEDEIRAIFQGAPSEDDLAGAYQERWIKAMDDYLPEIRRDSWAHYAQTAWQVAVRVVLGREHHGFDGMALHLHNERVLQAQVQREAVAVSSSV